MTNNVESVQVSPHGVKQKRAVSLPTSLEVVVNLIGSTKTEAGLEVHEWLDESEYEKSKKVSDAQLAEVIIKRDNFHGEWNYKILPAINVKYGS